MIEFRCLDCGRRVISYYGEPGIAHCASREGQVDE